MITFTTPKHHWNYFLALERDLEKMSRYVEFAEANLGTYSIELTHLLLTASSEVDVVLKQICALLGNQNADNINQYKTVIVPALHNFPNEPISINRFGMTYQPWINWAGATNPNWWISHNNVKHQRNVHFAEANLQNTINAVGALLITIAYYYQLAFSQEAGAQVSLSDTLYTLKPESTFITLDAEYYYHHLVV